MTELIICTTCRHADTPSTQAPDGEALWEAVQAAQAFGDTPAWADIHVRAMACLSGCSRACTAGYQAVDKHSYVFGDLAATHDVARQLLDGAVMHHQAADGAMPWGKRPEALASGMLSRLPPTL